LVRIAILPQTGTLKFNTSMLPPLCIASIYTHPMPPIRHRPSKETIIQEAITAHRTRHYGTPTRAAISHGIHPDTILKRINRTRQSCKEAYQFQQKLSPEFKAAVKKYYTILIKHHFPLKKSQIYKIALDIYKKQLQDAG
jgi:hypothetical protein